MKIIVTNINRLQHCDVISELADCAGFGHSCVEFNRTHTLDQAIVYVGTVESRGKAGIPEVELYGPIAKIAMLGATVSVELDGGERVKTFAKVNVNGLTRSELSQPLHGTAAEPAKPFIDSRFNKVE